MSRASEAAIKAYPNYWKSYPFETNKEARAAFIKGYEQAEKDIISLIESRIGEILGDAQPKPALRAELQELIKRIKEEQK